MQSDPAFDDAMWESRMLVWAEAGEVVDDTDLALELDPELGLSAEDLAAVRELWQTVVEEWEDGAADPWDSLSRSSEVPRQRGRCKDRTGERLAQSQPREWRAEWEPRRETDHPVVGLLTAVERLLAEAAELSPATWSVSTKSDALLTLARVSARADALATSVLREATDLADREAFRDPARW